MTKNWEDMRFPKLHKGVCLRSEDSGFLVFNPNSDTILQTNSVGAEIFRHCDGRHSISEISNLLAGKFEVEEQVAYKDIRAFLFQLVELKLVEYV